VPVLFGGRSVESHIKKTVRLPTMRAQ